MFRFGEKQLNVNGKGLLGYRGWNLVPVSSSLDSHPTPTWDSRPRMYPPTVTALSTGLRLMSLTWVEFWDNQPKTATCVRSQYPMSLAYSDYGHLGPLVPAPNCMCGYWMTETPEELHLNTDQYRFGPNLLMEVAGLVQAWGRCIRHDSGVRCQHMRIVALLGRTSPLWARRAGDELNRLGRKFDVPVLLTLEELVRFKNDWETSG